MLENGKHYQRSYLINLSSQGGKTTHVHTHERKCFTLGNVWLDVCEYVVMFEYLMGFRDSKESYIVEDRIQFTLAQAKCAEQRWDFFFVSSLFLLES